MICKNCKKELSNEMLKANLCWNCGQIIDENLAENTDYNDIEIETEYVSINDDNDLNININSIAKSIKVFAKIIMVIGSVLNILVLFIASQYHTFLSFLAFEMIFVISGFLLLGFSEIIQLLQDIKNKI